MVFNTCEALNALAENYLKVEKYSQGFIMPKKASASADKITLMTC